jgi:hypothetical protein
MCHAPVAWSERLTLTIACFALLFEAPQCSRNAGWCRPSDTLRRAGCTVALTRLRRTTWRKVPSVATEYMPGESAVVPTVNPKGTVQQPGCALAALAQDGSI